MTNFLDIRHCLNFIKNMTFHRLKSDDGERKFVILTENYQRIIKVSVLIKYIHINIFLGYTFSAYASICFKRQIIF
jgi:hypothetical protein